MDDNRIQECIPVNSQDKQIPKIGSEPSKNSLNSKSGDPLLIITDLVKNYQSQDQPFIPGSKKGCLKRISFKGKRSF